MKLCAVYCEWGDYDILIHSVENISKMVDGVIIITSRVSNYGEKLFVWWDIRPIIKSNYHVFEFNPDINMPAVFNETNKRNAGLAKASELGYTHFVMMDADEFYEPSEFLKEKERFKNNPSLLGLVCRTKVYFKKPTLTIGYDTTLVPFIHKITSGLEHQFNRRYPFAWSDKDGVPFTEKKRIRIDPTRSLNINSGVEWSDITMHHYSWVRADVNKKVRNSTARENIKTSSILTDYCQAKPGHYCQFYKAVLEECPNVFGIPETIIDDNVCTENIYGASAPEGKTFTN